MYYATNTITLIPGKRFEAIAHLQKLAKFICDTYGTPAEVVGNMTGPVYACHMVTKYDNLAQYEQDDRKLMADPFFAQWFEESVSLLSWQDARSGLYEIYG